MKGDSRLFAEMENKARTHSIMSAESILLITYYYEICYVQP